MRIYLAGTVGDLAQLRERGEIEAGFTAHAVTPALREWYAESDTEELEHAAFLDAERRSLHRLAADPSVARRRVVIAADVPDDAVLPAGSGDGEDRALVLVRTGLSLPAVASVHLDEAAAEADVTAAVGALAAAAGGDDDAQFLVDSAEGHDLLWYDVTELDDVLLTVGP